MNGYYSDTHPEMEDLQIRLLREVPSWKKMKMMVDLTESAKKLALAGLRNRHPDASDKELRRRLADLLLGEKIAFEVYGEIDHAG